MPEPNEHLRAIRRMSERMPERIGRVHMDMNERVTPFAPAVLREMLAQIRPELLCHYPDASPLYERLSQRLGYPQEMIYVTPGSDAGIRMLFQAYLRPGDRVVFPDPTFAMYAIYTQVFQAQARTVAYGKGRTLDVDRLERLVADGARVLAVANPDQPTGAVMDRERLEALAHAAQRGDALFIIDEAYYPFYPQSAIDLATEFDNVAILRTFSKVGGLAGLRVGYVVANPKVIDAMTRVRGSFEVNTVAIAMACYLLDHPEIAADFLREVEAGREVLRRMAQALGLGFPDGRGNFQLLQFAATISTAEVARELAAKGYLVKGGFSAPCVSDCIRVTLAGPELMTRFWQDCAEILKRFAPRRGR
jgi:histidinol-phosphate aminotransferase